MAVYSVRAFTGTFTAASPRPIAYLWNQDASQRIQLIEFGIYLAGVIGGGTGSYALNYTSTKGTPVSTVTPDADNCWDGHDAPPSGAVLDIGQYTADPTVVDALSATRLGTVAGSAGQGVVFDVS